MAVWLSGWLNGWVAVFLCPCCLVVVFLCVLRSVTECWSIWCMRASADIIVKSSVSSTTLQPKA